MTMTRKDYRVIAQALRELGGLSGPQRLVTVDICAEAIARALHANSALTSNGNRKFDRERFLEWVRVR